MGILALGLIATVAYNLTYFASRRRPPVASQDPLTIVTPAVPQAAPQAVTNSIGTIHPSETGSAEISARPPFSPEEIAQQAQSPLTVALNREPLPKRAYLERDPFRGAPAVRQPVRETEPKSTPSTSPDELDASPPETPLRVTAILVQGERRFAVINGYPKRVGSHMGTWQIAAIEPDYVMVKTPDGDRKIEIHKQLADAKLEPKP